MERSWLGAESMMQKCDIEEIHLVKKSILLISHSQKVTDGLHKLELSEKTPNPS